jgi:hypothetical protein
LGQKEEKKEGRDKERFCILKREQPYEFKYKFEFKHPKKVMHQHECNKGNLWLIN